MRKMVLLLGTIMMLALGFGMSVMAFSTGEKDFSKEEYREMEAEYLEEARQILLEKGCKNAGITLTYIVDQEDNRKYTVSVHHRKFEEFNQEARVLLQARMKEAGELFLDGKIHMVKILSDI